MSDVVVPLILFVVLLILVGIVGIFHVIYVKLKIVLFSLEQQLEENLELVKKKEKESMKENIMKGNKNEEIKSLKTEKCGLKKEKSNRLIDETKKEMVCLFEGDLVSLIKQLAPFLDEFSNHPEQFDVCPNVVPGFLYNALPSHPPEDPCSLEDIWKDYTTIVWSGYTHWQHPNFVAYFPCGRSVPDTAAELLTSVFCVSTKDWASCPALIELEITMVNWYGRAFNLPEYMLYHGNPEKCQGGGESASEAIFAAVTTARSLKIDEIMMKKKKMKLTSKDLMVLEPGKKTKLERQHELAGRLVVYASTEAHSSIEKGCRMAMVELRQLKGVPKHNYAMTAAVLETAIIEDLARGRIPCMLHVICGSTSSCTFDELSEIGPIAKKYGMWVHVDGAYAGAMWIEPSYRDTQKGIEYADSININPHKTLLSSNPLSILWTRNQQAFRNVFKNDINRGHKLGDDPRDLFIHDTRRVKALKTWFVLKTMGVEGLSQHVRQLNNLSIYLKDLILSHPNVRLFGQHRFGTFCFQYTEQGMTDEEVTFHSECLTRLMNETGQIWITFSMVHGHGIIRMSIGYEQTNKEDMDRLWTFIKEQIDKYRERRNDPNLIRFWPTKSFNHHVVSPCPTGGK